MNDCDNKYFLKRRHKIQDERSEATKYHRPKNFVHSRVERLNYSKSRSRTSSSTLQDRSNYEQATKRRKYNNCQNSEYHNNQAYQQSTSNVTPIRLSPMSFKTFILAQGDDSISKTNAIASYNKYKLKFQIDQLEYFFEVHQNKDWFRIKYHPEDLKKHNEEQANALKRRCDVFLELLNANKFDCVNVDSDKTNDLLKILDTVVMKLEGGTEEDIAALEMEYSKVNNKIQNVEPATDTTEMIREETVEKKGVNTETIIEKLKTSSICLHNLPSTIAHKEIESMCSIYNGFIRVSLSDPKPENNWLRQGWLTFKRGSNVKKICWNMNNLRLKDFEFNAVVTEDLADRICLVNGITADKEVVKSDIRISAKILLHLDKQTGLWLDNDEESENKKEKVGFLSNNPVLRNVNDYLVEETSSEELLGLNPDSEKPDETNLDRDDDLIAILDKIILYLRIVHSIDYYNHCKYGKEDEMPNRCRVLHVRGPPPTSKSEISQFLGKKVEAKLKQFLPEKLNKTESELINLYLKDSDSEVEKFVLNNTKKLGPNKWKCPLSGKKFLTPDFVRKHIFLKYSHKIEEVKTNAEFFNNYLRDSQRVILSLAQPEKQKNCVPLNERTARVKDVQSTSSSEIIDYIDWDALPHNEDKLF